MTRSDWITIAVIALVLLVLIKFQGLKVWHALLVFGMGFYFATTPAGLFILTHVTHFIAAVGH